METLIFVPSESQPPMIALAIQGGKFYYIQIKQQGPNHKETMPSTWVEMGIKKAIKLSQNQRLRN